MNLQRSETITVKRIRPRLKPLHGPPDLLPFINVFFLLLIFFMIGSSFVPVSGVQVNLPEATAVSSYSMKKYIITLDHDERMYFNDAVVEDLYQLKGKLQDIPAGDDAAIILRADRSCNFDTIAKIMALAEEMHLNMFILARKSDSGRTVFTDTERR